MTDKKKILEKDMSNIKIMFLITKSPFTSRTPNKAYQYAKYLLKHGGIPVIFHYMDGIYNLNKFQYALNFPIVYKMVEELIRMGAKVGACSRCLIARGFWDKELSNIDEKTIVPSHIINGIKINGVSNISQNAKKGYKILKF